MIEREFELQEHEEFGNNGLKPVWMRDSDPYGGMAVAHDILEHFPSEPGPVEGEFMALGAAFYIRGEGGYWAMKGNVNPPEKHLASDIPDIIGRVRNGAQSLGVTPRTLPLDSDVERSIGEILNNASREMRDRDMERLSAVERSSFAAWFRRGYRGVQRRYRGRNSAELAYLFSKIEERADQLIKTGVIGERFVFKVEPATCRFFVDERYDEVEE